MNKANAKYKVVTIKDVDTKDLFENRQWILGDVTKGKWFVIGDDTGVLGRYADRETADFHAECLNAPDDPCDPYKNKSTDEMIADLNSILEEIGEEPIGDTNNVVS